MSLSRARQAAEEWLRLDRHEPTLSQVRSLVSAADTGDTKAAQSIEELFSATLSFGTAGLRGSMGAGPGKLNDLTVIQAALGVARSLPRHPTVGGVVIGYDGRHNSRRFAERFCAVLIHEGVRSLLFSSTTPTPFVPFAIRLMSLDAGIMITASHNPKDDNGVKVYWNTGAQIIAPVDEQVSAAIERNRTSIPDAAWSDGWKRAADPTKEVEAAYFSSMRSALARPNYLAANAASSIRIVYSAMHGVGGPAALKSICEVFGIPRHNVFVVDEQFHPDPEFPTVKFPNPEEGKESLDLSIRLGNRAGAHIILANDPDADRLAVAERRADGSWKLFTGDELGALFGAWALDDHRAAGKPVDDTCVMLSSAVSSAVLGSMARREGFRHEQTLTGFKWMGTRASQLERTTSGRVIFAYEEAIGFMIGDRVLDKDGITAAGIAATIAAQAYNTGSTLSQKLADVFSRYGYHTTSNSYALSPSPKVTTAIFSHMSANPPREIGGVKVVRLRDLTTGTDTGVSGGRAVLPVSRVSPMITFWFDNGVSITIRGSGTEPKVKWYAERISKEAPAPGVLENFVAEVVDALLKPEARGLKRRSAL